MRETDSKVCESMRSSVLITGAGPNGVTGRLLRERLEEEFDVISPSSKELDLTDDLSVGRFFADHHIDYVIHCATFRKSPNAAIHKVDEELESNLRMYYSLASQSQHFKKMIYLGSGAEFDKRFPIVNANEEYFGKTIPANKYGLAKYIMNVHCRQSSNIYNFRLFGTINKYESPNKNVVSNICVKAIFNMPIRLRQNCRFSFISIDDLVKYINYGISHVLSYHDYNIVMAQSYMLSEICEIVISLHGDGEFMFEHDGLNLEYTGSDERISKEFPSIQRKGIEEAVEIVYQHFKEHKSEIIIDDIDKRWQ